MGNPRYVPRHRLLYITMRKRRVTIGSLMLTLAVGEGEEEVMAGNDTVG
jgi:hypothetical protein